MTHWASLFIDRNADVCFDFFKNLIYLRKFKYAFNKIRDKSITRNIFRIQTNDSIMCEFYCIAFIEYMLSERTLLDYNNLFSPKDFKKNDKIIYNCFNDKYGKPRV